MALVVGTTIRIKGGGPHLRGVVMTDDQKTVQRTFEHISTAGAEPEEQLNDLAQAVEAELKAQPVRAAVVREASFNVRAGLSVPNKHRLRAEGVTLHVLRIFTPLVLVGDIVKLRAILTMSPEEFKQAGIDAQPGDWAEAATAALVACTL